MTSHRHLLLLLVVLLASERGNRLPRPVKRAATRSSSSSVSSSVSLVSSNSSRSHGRQMSPTTARHPRSFHAQAGTYRVNHCLTRLLLLLLALLGVVRGSNSSSRTILLQQIRQAEWKCLRTRIWPPAPTRSGSKSSQTLSLTFRILSAATPTISISHWSRLRPQTLNQPTRVKGARLDLESSHSPIQREETFHTGVVGQMCLH